MIKSPIGIALAAAAVILAVSPEARKGVRRLAVKGTGAVLDMSDQLKNATRELQAFLPNKELLQGNDVSGGKDDFSQTNGAQ